jgi:hypothetical protein
VTTSKAAPRLFDDRLSREWIGFTILRRIVIVVAVTHFSLAAVSGYRAVTQVYRASITTESRTLHDGSRISADIVTAGRTYVDVIVKLEQGAQSAVIATTVVPENESFFYDFRPKRAHFDVVVTGRMLTGFRPGPATVRVTATGNPQWLYLPPPKTDRVTVMLR